MDFLLTSLNIYIIINLKKLQSCILNLEIWYFTICFKKYLMIFMIMKSTDFINPLTTS